MIGAGATGEHAAKARHRDSQRHRVVRANYRGRPVRVYLDNVCRAGKRSCVLKPLGWLLFFLMISVTGAVFSAPNSAPGEADAIPVSDDYALRVWEVEDGLPNNNISSIAQTPDGYLWLSMWWGGLARFDGVRFTSFLKETTPGLESDRVQTVFVARDGALWVGLARGGVARGNGHRFETIVPLAPSTAPTLLTSSFAEDAEGAVWFGYVPDSEAFRWLNGTLSSFSEKQGIGPGVATFVHADKQGRVWFASKEGCGVFDGERFQAIDSAVREVVHLAPAAEGGMWALRGRRLLHYHADGTKRVVADFGVIADSGQVNTLYADRAGDLWIGTRSQGLFRFRDGNFVRVPTSHIFISAIMEDREGNLWVGTQGGGLNRLRPVSFSLRQVTHGLHHDAVVSVSEDTDGRLWLAARAGPPVRALDPANRSFASPPGWDHGVSAALCADPDGGMWGVLRDLMHWRDGVFSQENMREEMTALLLDRKGDLWMATTKKGLIRRRSSTVDPIPTTGGLVEPRALAEDAAGRVWVGTEAGLVFRRQNEEFVPVPLPEAMPGESIRFIVPDEQDTVWIGALDGGLYRWKAGRVARMSHTAGLPVEDLRSLLIEPGGDFWFGTGRGLVRVARGDLEATILGRRSRMRTLAYGRNDGLPSLDFAFGFRNATTRTSDGHLWFATYNGALEVIPQNLKSAPPVPVRIERIQLGGEAVFASGHAQLTFPPQPGPLQIHFTLPNLSAPEHIHFRYRLTGLSDDWVLTDDQRVAVFAHLPPGDYRFEVSAAEANGDWLPSASLAFTVRAAWWETAWVRLGAGVLGAGALAALVRLGVKRRMRARMRRLEQEHALERERTRIARDMHDELGASLTRIALMSDLAAGDAHLPPETGRQLGAIAAAARTMSGTLDEIVWTVNPRNDTLERLVGYLAEFAREHLAPTPLALELDLPVQVPAYPLSSDTRHHLLMAVKETLNNAVKHASATTLRLRVRLENEILTIVIADDGRGFAPETIASSSNGLINSRQRLAAINGSYSIDSRPDVGTEVVLTLPLPPPLRHDAGRMSM